MGTKRKICVITGSRAEYGLLYWLMKEIQSDPDLDLQVIVTGMHLSPEFGLTYKVIEKDGFVIHEKVDMLLSSDTAVGVTKSMGLATIGFADAFERLKPDLVVILGDRFEILAAAQAALVAQIPIAHIHGGELTEGAVDEAIRHSITKMSQLHFVSAETYRKRIIQLGEEPARVFNFGAPGLDNIHRLKLLNRQELEKVLQWTLGKTNFLITYHPVTLSKESPMKAINELFRALDHFPEAKIIFTKQNSDTSGRIIGQLIDEYVLRNQNRAAAYTSLGQLNYLSMVRQADVVIGNSSSGLIEVPALQKPTVNMGVRQRGRVRGESIIDCEESESQIATAIKKALSVDFQAMLSKVKSPYGEGGTSKQIKEVIKKTKLEDIVMKKFYDLENVKKD